MKRYRMPAKYVGLIIAGMLLLVSGQVLASNNQLKNIRVSTNKQNTRLVFEFIKSPSFHAFTLLQPDRIVVDLKRTTLSFKTADLNTNDYPLIHALRKSQKGNALRLVFDLSHAVKIHSFTLPSSHGQAERLVIDIEKLAYQPKPVATASSFQKPKEEPLRDAVIVIDPGHGGKDPGAVGVGGVYEKQVVLAIAKELQKQIQSKPGFKAVLTRKGDFYVPLRTRMNIARKDNGDMFLSIHADAFQNKHSGGASVFALSARGASSEAAHWLAQQENYSELGGVELKDKSYVLRSVLIDLAQTATISSSLEAGGRVLKRVGKITELHKGKVEQARFVVLKSPDIPSLLIETGFLSNPKEAKRLRSKAYQKKIAKAISDGIQEFFESYPPRGTFLSARGKMTDYKVKRGDSIGKIAERFAVTSTELRKANHLKKDTIRIGQVLHIPRSHNHA